MKWCRVQGRTAVFLLVVVVSGAIAGAAMAAEKSGAPQVGPPGLRF